ncbi:MAG: hypothetical protein JW737_05745 [Acidobacteria bacterium]|nr:hypothetical protein [Acidobacteriota bacterium]
MKFLPIVLMLILGLTISVWVFMVQAAKDLPDIYIDKIEIKPFQGTEFKDGAKAIMKCTVKRGNVPANAFHVAFYQGSKFIKEIRITPTQFTSGEIILSAGFNYDKNIFKYSCVADSRNTVSESNENNNKKEYTYLPITYINPDEVETVPIEVVGDISADSIMITEVSSFVEYYQVHCFYHYKGPELEKPIQASMSIKALNPSSFVISQTIKPKPDEYGIATFEFRDDHSIDEFSGKLKCIFDMPNTLKEYNESNNTAVFDKNNNIVPSGSYPHPIIIKPVILPDIKAMAFTLKRDTSFSDVITNIIPPGTFYCSWAWEGDPADAEWKISLYIDDKEVESKVITKAETLKRIGIVQFASKGYPGSTSSTRKAKCVVDPNNKIKERDETNNEKTITYQ